jgi:DNA-binding beta-propeller fold protein YncE
MNPTLATNNEHKRDTNISFQEEGHKYTIHTDPHSKYTSVTTWNHSHFPHFNADLVIQKMMKGKNWNPQSKYWGMTPEQIKAQWNANGAAVSGAGTELHYEIECFMNDPEQSYPYTHKQLAAKYNLRQNELKDAGPPDQQNNNPENELKDPTKEWLYFLDFLRDYPDLKPYRTEWMIYDEELKLSGSIDMVYENPDGSLMIYDWKRSKEISRVNNFNEYAKTQCISHLPNSNFWHYALQLNTYKAILQRKYDKVVTDLYLVRLHPDAEEGTYELLKLPDLSEYVRELFELRKQEIQSKPKFPDIDVTTTNTPAVTLHSFWKAKDSLI